jgi:uncharacterized protein with LGFP repeats
MNAWRAQNWEAGPLGYPVADQRCGLTNGGCLQNFQHGTIYNNSASGTHTVLNGALMDAWRAQNWEAGPLGYPASDAYPVAQGTAQDFQGGRLVLNSTTGVVSQN